MKKLSTRQTGLILSFIFAIIVYVVGIIAYKTSSFFLIYSVSTVAVFLLIYFLLQFLLNIFIAEKTKSIYKIINYFPQRGKEAKLKKKQGFVDIDEAKYDVEQWAQNQLQEIEGLKNLERYRKDFIGNVSHELKTTIFNIQGYILTLLEGGLEDPKINKLYLMHSEKNIDRMISIVEDLESITKLETGELKPQYSIFDIVKVTKDVFEMEYMMSKERKISLQFADKLDKPVMVNADKKKIIEVLMNLVTNGIKYGKEKGYIKVRFYDFDEKVTIEVSDNGIGIDKKDLPHIFERFYRVDKYSSRRQGGTGLGLSIVKHIIEDHNQTINVQSVLNEGTIFTFTLEKAK